LLTINRFIVIDHELNDSLHALNLSFGGKHSNPRLQEQSAGDPEYKGKQESVFARQPQFR